MKTDSLTRAFMILIRRDLMLAVRHRAEMANPLREQYWGDQDLHTPKVRHESGGVAGLGRGRLTGAGGKSSPSNRHRPLSLVRSNRVTRPGFTR